MEIKGKLGTVSEVGLRTTRIKSVGGTTISLDLEVIYWITDMGNWKMIIHEVNMGLKRNLDAAGVDTAFPTETHYIVNQK